MTNLIKGLIREVINDKGFHSDCKRNVTFWSYHHQQFSKLPDWKLSALNPSLSWRVNPLIRELNNSNRGMIYLNRCYCHLISMFIASTRSLMSPVLLGLPSGAPSGSLFHNKILNVAWGTCNYMLLSRFMRGTFKFIVLVDLEYFMCPLGECCFGGWTSGAEDNQRFHFRFTYAAITFQFNCTIDKIGVE